jgi:hypothetical protein
MIRFFHTLIRSIVRKGRATLEIGKPLVARYQRLPPRIKHFSLALMVTVLILVTRLAFYWWPFLWNDYVLPGLAIGIPPFRIIWVLIPLLIFYVFSFFDWNKPVFRLIEEYLKRDQYGRFYQQLRHWSRKIFPGVSHRYLVAVYSHLFDLEAKSLEHLADLDYAVLYGPKKFVQTETKNSSDDQPANCLPAQCVTCSRLGQNYEHFKQHFRWWMLALNHIWPNILLDSSSQPVDQRSYVVMGLLATLNHIYAEWLTDWSWNREADCSFIISVIDPCMERLIPYLKEATRKEVEKEEYQNKYQSIWEIQKKLLQLSLGNNDFRPNEPDDLHILLSEITHELKKVDFDTSAPPEKRDLFTLPSSRTALIISQARLLGEGYLRGIGYSAEEHTAIFLSQQLTRYVDWHPRVAYTCGISWHWLFNHCLSLPGQDFPARIARATRMIGQLYGDPLLIKAGASQWFISTQREK